MKTRLRKISIIVLAFAVTFTSLPLVTGDFVASAASVKRPAQVKNLKKAASSTSSITLKWSRQRKRTSGYIVYRYIPSARKWVSVKRIAGNKNVKWKVSKLKPNKSYKFRVYAYRKYKGKYYRSYKYASAKYKTQKPRSSTQTEDNKQDQTISLDVTSKTLSVGNTFDINALADSGLAVSYESSNTKVATVTSAGRVTAKSAGTAIITVSQSGNNTYNAAVSKTVDVTVTSVPLKFPESPDRYCMYNDAVKVYPGQDFTTTLLDQLKNASDGGYKMLTRTGYECYTGDPNGDDYKVIDSNMSVDIHFFGISTYDPFLAVYVARGQVIQFCYNGENLGMFDGKTVTRGDKEEDWIKDTACIAATPSCTKPREGQLGILLCQMSCSRDYKYLNGTTAETFQSAIERELSVYFVNAARIAGGVNMIKRSYYLEGVGPAGMDLPSSVVRMSDGTLRYTGTASNGKPYTNQRFGAQAWAESMYESGIVTHDTMTVGPHANVGPSTIINCIYKELTGNPNAFVGDNVGTHTNGESIFGASYSHWTSVMDTNVKSMGVGFYGGKSAMFFAEAELD